MDPRADPAATFCATLIDEWIQNGVSHAVIAPGSRSTVMALALANRTDLQVHVFHDERSAAFAALGIGLLGTPAVLVCTSGTAAAHFHAAVIEAHLSAVPLLVCTTDRPPELRDVGAPQTIDQTKLYGSAVRWFHDPGVADDAASGTWRSLAAHAYGSATGVWPGPVHLNLPFREPLLGTAGELPSRSSLMAVTYNSNTVVSPYAITRLATRVSTPRGVIVAGRGCDSADGVLSLAAVTGWPVLADARSGLRHLDGVALSAADSILRSPEFAAAHRPDIVIRLGQPPVSKVLNQWLAGLEAYQIHVTPVPTWTDPDGVIAHRIVAEPGSVCSALATHLSCADESWLRGWVDAERRAQAAIETLLTGAGLTEPGVARAVVASMEPGSHLIVSSSMPIRDVEWFSVVPDGVTVHCNRGANGIDGVIATATGVALATGAPTTVLIGDVAFLHDSSSLTALAGRDVDLRIVVIDNDGGGIFSFLPQAAALPADRFEQLFGTPHGVDVVALAAAHSIPAADATSIADVVAAVNSPGTHLTLVRSNRAANVAVHAAVNAAVVAALAAH
ncbi:MAG: 2-succinyl-5-enolpyruvyl-6-hydroxy-3-cyclohexene-1-carboxylic-acid synthase [Ilumatobacteraceae bacterium]